MTTLPPTGAEIATAARQFDLIEYRENWEELRLLKENYDLAKRQYERYLGRLKAKIGNADELVLNGQVVATHAISGAFNESKFRDEQGALYQAYVKPRLIDAFDADEFREHNPGLYEQYRSRSLRFKA